MFSQVSVILLGGCGYVSNDDHQGSLAEGWYVQGVGMSEGLGVRGPMVYSPLPPPVLTPSGSHQNTCGFGHPTGMLCCCFIHYCGG